LRNKLRFLRRLLIIAMISVIVIPTMLALYIYQYGQVDQASSADTIVVLGAGISSGGVASPATARRVRHAVALYKKGLAPSIICTGGFSRRYPKSEAQACSDLAQRQGVPSAAILLEERSTSTEENAIETRKIMDARGLKTALVVSDNFHLLRAEILFNAQGIRTIVSPAQITSGPLAWWRIVQSSYREVLALAWYGVKTVLGLPYTNTKL
jgi:uncharacterized SAM-binding protein YcdF (DUF218 family)